MISGGLEVVDGLLWEDEAVAPTKNAIKYVKDLEAQREAHKCNV